MDYKKLFGWGILIYVVAFIVISGFVAYDMAEGIIATIATLVAITIVVCFAGRNLKAESVMGVLKYSIGWLVIVVILDMLFSVPFAGWGMFKQWSVLLGYAIILLVPLKSICCKGKGRSVPQQTPPPSQPSM